MPWIKIAKTVDISDGRIRSFAAGDKKVAVAHVGSEFFAIDDICTHAQCSLGEGSLIGYEVECPCHGARFDLVTGGVRALPAASPVSVYKVKVGKEEVLVKL